MEKGALFSGRPLAAETASNQNSHRLIFSSRRKVWQLTKNSNKPVATATVETIMFIKICKLRRVHNFNKRLAGFIEKDKRDTMHFLSDRFIEMSCKLTR